LSNISIVISTVLSLSFSETIENLNGVSSPLVSFGNKCKLLPIVGKVISNRELKQQSIKEEKEEGKIE
jgi:hypothetical protein